MSNHAHVENGVVVQVDDDPENHFTPEVARLFAPVPAEVREGWRRDEDGNWLAPTAPAADGPRAAPVDA